MLAFLPKDPAWELMFLLASATFVVYNLRVCVSVAVLDMSDDLDWTDAEKGYVLSAFYWGKWFIYFAISVVVVFR